MSDPNYPPSSAPSSPDPNAGWSNVHSGTPAGGQYPPAGSSYPPAGSYPPPNQYPPAGSYPPPAASTGLSSGVAAGLCYLFWPIAIVFLIIDPYKRDPLVRFSAMQTLALLVVCVAFSILQFFITVFHIPFLGLIVLLVSMFVWLAIGICWLIAMIKAFTGQRWKIPVVGDMADKFSASVSL